MSLDDGLRKDKIQVTYGVLDSRNELVFGWLRETLEAGTCAFELPLYGYESRGKYSLSLGVTVGKQTDNLLVPMLNVLEDGTEGRNDT